MLFCSSDLAIEDVTPEKRDCLFPRERDLQLFAEYSFSNCLLECYLNLTQAAPQLQCLPWYMPRPDPAPRPSCDPWRSLEFTREMGRIEPSQCAHCAPDCESVQYLVTATSNKFR